MDQTRANQQSTQPPILSTNQDTTQDTTPTPVTKRTHNAYVALHHVTGLVQSDQTGRFPTVSSKCKNYIMVLYDYDTNYIHKAPLKTRSGPDIIAAYQTIHAFLVSRGMQTKIQRLNNEASTALLQLLTDHHIDNQLAPLMPIGAMRQNAPS
jgi:hypothetical protein